MNQNLLVRDSNLTVSPAAGDVFGPLCEYVVGPLEKKRNLTLNLWVTRVWSGGPSQALE